MITLNKIINGIIEALIQEFNSEDNSKNKYEIYTEDVEQGLKEPCFSITFLRQSVTHVINNRYYKHHLFCIYYFPKETEEDEESGEKESFDILERLYKALEYIIVDGDLVRGTDMNAEIVDNVISLTVNFDLFVNKEQEKQSNMYDLSHIMKARKRDV